MWSGMTTELAKRKDSFTMHTNFNVKVDKVEVWLATDE